MNREEIQARHARRMPITPRIRLSADERQEQLDLLSPPPRALGPFPDEIEYYVARVAAIPKRTYPEDLKPFMVGHASELQDQASMDAFAWMFEAVVYWHRVTRRIVQNSPLAIAAAQNLGAGTEAWGE